MKRFAITLVLLTILIIIFGCASQDPLLLKREMRNVTHFVTFRSDPIGADVIVVDSLTGKEVGNFGKTPVRILLLSKTIDTNGHGEINLTKINPAAFAVTYGGKIRNPQKDLALQADGAEFQFKFKMSGYFDEIQITRVPFRTSTDTDVIINVNLKSAK